MILTNYNFNNISLYKNSKNLIPYLKSLKQVKKV